MGLLCEDTDFASPRSLVDRESVLSGKGWYVEGVEDGEMRGKPETDTSGGSEAGG